MKKQTMIALKFLLIMTILTGIIYPLLMTGAAQLIFPLKANGSLVIRSGKIIGSDLIGQRFDNTIYFWSRPSAVGYNPIPSGASNLGPTSDTLRKLVAARASLFSEMNYIPMGSVIPKEMIFASGSGLDPQISPEAALLQVDRIIKARHFDQRQKDRVLEEIKKLTEKPQDFFLGEERINVLRLNLYLDEIDENMNEN
jgi:K+-transporting ATPase ATPase C chain